MSSMFAFAGVGTTAGTTALLADLAGKSVLVFAAAWLAALALRRRSAASRQLVWSLGIVAALALPVLSLALPEWPVLPAAEALTTDSVLAQHDETDSTIIGPVAELPGSPLEGTQRPDVPAQAIAAAENATVVDDEAQAAQLPAATIDPPGGPHRWLLAVWLAGAALALVPLVGGWLQVWRLASKCQRVTGGSAWQMLGQLAGSINLRRRPGLLFADCRTIPMTWGILRPVILLPRSAQRWPQGRLRAVLLHELAHVQRRDCLVQCLAQAARAMYWFNPLAWLAYARLRVEQEQSCDDRVLAAGCDAADYAEHLLAVTSASPRGQVQRIALAAARGFRQVRRRMQRILDPHRDRRGITRRAALTAVAASLALLMPLACLRWQSAEAQEAGDRKAKAADTTEADTEAARLAEVRAKLLEHYIGPADKKLLTEGAIRGMVRALDDSYSDYLDADAHADLEKSMTGTLQGVGLMLELKTGQPVVLTPLVGSPALRAGLRAGDVIVAVDGKPTLGVPLANVVRQIVGPADSTVKLKYRRGDAETEVSVKREKLRIDSVTGFRRGADQRWTWMLNEDAKIGYVRVAQFGPDTPAALGEALKRLKDGGVKALILDLRFCPGGLMSAAVDSARLFLAEGNIVTVKSPKRDETHKADGKAVLPDVPLMVLVNDHTASAAEIVAGALQDNRRAILVGMRTHGKGSVQQLIPVETGGVLKVTTAHYYLPSGRNIHRRPGEKTWGVDPDDGYYLPMTSAQAEALIQRARTRDQAPSREAPQGDLTVKQIEAEHGDPQLAATLATMITRVKRGEAIPMGKTRRELAADLERGFPLRQRRETLLKELEKIDRELDELAK